jgi:hypothetical protein
MLPRPKRGDAGPLRVEDDVLTGASIEAGIEQPRYRMLLHHIRRNPDAFGILITILVSAVVLIPNVLTGGFGMDDWISAGQYLFHPGHGFWSDVTSSQVYPARAPMAVFGAIVNVLFGVKSPRPFLALLSLTDVAVAVLVVLIIRRLRLPVATAVSAAILLILMPMADSTAFWSGEEGPAFFGRALFLLALYIALCGFARSGARRIAWELFAVILYALSVYGYELAAPPVIVAGGLTWS